MADTDSLSRPMQPLLAEADVLLLIGTRTNQNATYSWKLYPASASIIHIDIDGTEIGRNYEALRLVGDAKLALAGRRSADPRRARPALEFRIAEARQAGNAAASANMTCAAMALRP